MTLVLRRSPKSTETKLILEHDPIPGATGFRLSHSRSDRRAHTWDGARTEHAFPADVEWATVEALGVLAEGTWRPGVTTSPLSPLPLPDKFHIWGGNERAKMLECGLVVAAFTSNADPRVARQANPRLIALSHPALDPWQADWRLRKGYAWTYGGGLTAFTGAADSLDPSPQGQIRGWSASDAGCRQADGLQGFALHRLDTATFIAQATLYAWKLGRFAELGYDGVWSDNLFPSDVLSAGWCYGACGATIPRDAWDAGILHIARYLREKAGEMLLGGNVCYRATDPALRAELTVTLRENLDVVVQQGIDAVWADVQRMHAWQTTPTAHGLPRIAAVNDRVPRADTARQRFGLAVALVYGAVYAAYDGNHANTYWPAEIAEGGRVGYLGLPTGPPERSGSVLSRRYGERTVRADFATRTATFA